MNNNSDETPAKIAGIFILERMINNMSIRYTFKETGVGIIDNLGVQLQKVIRGANQGSLESRYRYVDAAERFIRFAGEKFRLQRLQNLQDKHIEAYVAYMKQRGCTDKYITQLSHTGNCSRALK